MYITIAHDKDKGHTEWSAENWKITLQDSDLSIRVYVDRHPMDRFDASDLADCLQDAVLKAGYEHDARKAEARG